jgi:polyisoprenoid-binding protein YceI
MNVRVTHACLNHSSLCACEAPTEKGGFMTRRVMLILFLILSGVASKDQTAAQTGRDFTINVPDGKVEFFVGSSAGDVNGVFKTWTGKLSEASAGVPESASLNLNVTAASMSTGSGLKDKMVKGRDFFYVQDFPRVSFLSTKVISSGDSNKFQVQGNFTLRGVTKTVVLQVTLDRYGKGGGQVYGDLSFDRWDFGMAKSVPFVGVSDSVRVRMDLHLAPTADAAVTERYSWAKVIRIRVDR